LEEAKKDKNLNAKNPALKFPMLETPSGEVITELSAIASHLARMNPGSGLLGSSPFQEAQVNSWINWSQCLQPQVQSLVEIITGKTAKFEMSDYNELVTKVKNGAIAVNAALKGK
jgi:glutathione S-transferase